MKESLPGELNGSISLVTLLLAGHTYIRVCKWCRFTKCQHLYESLNNESIVTHGCMSIYWMLLKPGMGRV